MTDPVGVSDQQLTGQRCGYSVVDSDGIEQPCDRPAVGWRWYQDVEHEDMLDVACVLHENEGGRRMAALLAEVSRLQAENETGSAEWSRMAGEYNALIGERDAALARLAAVEKLRDRHRNTGGGRYFDLCDYCGEPWSSGAGSVPFGCMTYRELTAALAVPVGPVQDGGSDD